MIYIIYTKLLQKNQNLAPTKRFPQESSMSLRIAVLKIKIMMIKEKPLKNSYFK